MKTALADVEMTSSKISIDDINPCGLHLPDQLLVEYHIQVLRSIEDAGGTKGDNEQDDIKALKWRPLTCGI